MTIHNQKLGRSIFFVFTCLLLMCPCYGEDYKHDRWNTQPKDIVREFTAFIVSFDSADDDDGDEAADVWGIPEWVSYEMRKVEHLGPAPKRPQWFTDDELHELMIAPDDESYKFSEEWRDTHPNSKFLGFDRGHMCMKQHAWRLGAEADRETHTLLNICPQRAELNQGIWQDLENKTAQWADKYGRVWIICGPVIYGKKPQNWLGQRENNEVMVAIPDAFFKIVVREEDSASSPKVLAFIYPQRGLDYRAKNQDHTPYLTNINAIEHFTGLDFLTELPDEIEEQIEKETATELWPEQ